MKTRTIISVAALALCATLNARELPQFSSSDSDNWYHIVFDYGAICIKGYGPGETAYTRNVTPGDAGQHWELVGDADGFVLRSRDGNYALMNPEFTATADPEKATSFRLEPAGHQDFPDSWEIAINGKGDDYDRLNQYGGPLPGKTVGCWTPGDALNAISFISTNDIPSSPVTAPNVGEYKVVGAENYVPEHRHTLWYVKPVTAETVGDPWMEYALPVGNGEFGAMIYGGIHADRIQFNDKSLWTGSPRIRGSYQNFGNLYIEDLSDTFGVTDDKTVRNYIRNLDLEEGKANAFYTSPAGDTEYRREYLASYPDKVVAVRLSASDRGKISVRLSMFPGIKTGIVNAVYRNGGGSFEGSLNYIDFKAGFKAVPTGGEIITTDKGVEIRNADELLIVLAGATDFDQHSPDYLYDSDQMRAIVDRRLEEAAAKGWNDLLAAHSADYRELFNRASFNIDAAQNISNVEDMVTSYNKRRADRLAPAHLMLEELYWAYGRYLLISSSRGMDTPANLQGIWNHSDKPAWQCDIHSNINVQMNYWPAEPTNLSELHDPFLNYVHSMALEHSEWPSYARRSGQTKGWTCFTQNNIFGHSDYAENYVIANAWYTYHLWQHYLYTLDLAFLREKAFPVMRSCSEFWLERLVKDEDGLWVAPAEWSPEHGPSAEDGTAHAQQIVSELFASTLKAAEILGDEAADASFISELKEKYAALDKGLAIETYTGAWGDVHNDIETGTEILREWKISDYSAGEKEHRHQSHLMALYPFGQISPESEYFQPAVNSLRMRGDVSTGWSLGWRICLWARALDADHAHRLIVNALRHSTTYTQSSGGGGIYYNLFDSHAPFQIDGNFGYTAAVTEMLLQSHGGIIRLLPALAPIWKDGSITGIRAEGDFTVDQYWNELQLTRARIISGSGRDCRINHKGISEATITDNAGTEVNFEVIDDDNISFPTVTGAVYEIVTKEGASTADIYEENNLMITVSDCYVSTNDSNARISAYGVAGSALASGTGRLDLSAYSGFPVIVKAVGTFGTATAKVIVK